MLFEGSFHHSNYHKGGCHVFSKVEKTKKRIEWLRVQLIASQHHECYNLTEQIKEELKDAEDELAKLVGLR